VVRIDVKRFRSEVGFYEDEIGKPILAVVSPISEYRADVREVACLADFRSATADKPNLLTQSMDRLLNAPGRIVAPLRTRGLHTLKKAVKLKKPHVLGLAMRVWSGPTKIGTMGFVDLADETGQQIVLIWPQSWETLDGEIEEGRIYEAKLGTTKDQTLCCDITRGHYFALKRSNEES
jgi:hypothetical protein